MAAPDFATLYQVEEYLEDGISSLLQAAGLTVFTQRSASELSTPRVSVQAALGSESGHVFYADFNGEIRPDQWECDVRVQIVTDRTNSAVSHRTYKGLVRDAFAKWHSSFNLTYHHVYDWQAVSTAPTVASDEDQDITELNFLCKVAIRADAWPTS